MWTTLHLFQEKEAAELLGIPEDVTQIALFPVAHTIGTEFRPATRPPVEGITYRITMYHNADGLLRAHCGRCNTPNDDIVEVPHA